MIRTEGDRWRVGIIGCGRMGRVHAERLRCTGRAEIALLFDSDPAAAVSLQQDLAGESRLAPSEESLLNAHDLDAVVICSPTHRHAGHALAALQAGRHVLCEKPLADSRSALEQVLEAAAEAPVYSVLAYQRRFWGVYRALRREVRSGRYGAIVAAESHNTERWQRTIAGSWRDDPSMNPGGFLGDAGSHKIDALCYVTGLVPREAFARAQTRGSRVETLVSASVLMSAEAGGADLIPVTLDFVGCAEHQSEDLTIHCEGADLMVRDWRVWIARDNEVRPLEPQEPTSDPATGFVELLDGGGENPAPFTSAAVVWEFTQMLLESARSGRSVSR